MNEPDLLNKLGSVGAVQPQCGLLERECVSLAKWIRTNK